MCAIIHGVIASVVRMSYQYDKYLPAGDVQRTVVYEHYSPTLMRFKSSDCEDMAWANANLLCWLQRRESLALCDPDVEKLLQKCKKMLSCYAICNCVCQASAPTLALVAGDTGEAHAGPLINDEIERAEDAEFSAFHVTCLLFPLPTFLQAIARSPNNNFPPVFLRPETYLPPKFRLPHPDLLGKAFLAEGTMSMYADPFYRFTEPPPPFMGRFAVRKDVQVGMMPSGCNFPNDTNCFGALFNLTTDMFTRQPDFPSPPTMFLVTDKGVTAPVMEHLATDWPSVVVTPMRGLPRHKFHRARQFCEFEQPLPEMSLASAREFKTEVGRLRDAVKGRTFMETVFGCYFTDAGALQQAIHLPWVLGEGHAIVFPWLGLALR